MKIRFILLFMLVCLLAAAPSTFHAADAPSKSETPTAPSGEKDACLQCHGPFENLAAGPKTVTAEDGQKINPHQYVPHNRKVDKSIPICTKCHKPHPMPLNSKKDVPKAGIDWCYECHHTNEFRTCKDCHK